jgi:hypothetical protein
MNTKNFEDRVNPAEDVERTDQGENGPVVNTSSSVLTSLVQETPLGAGAVAVPPSDEAMIHEHEAPSDEKFPSHVAEVDAIAHEAVIGTSTGSLAALLNPEESEHFRTRWNEVQGKFVDEPRSAVQQADALVAEVIDRITAMFAKEHSLLEGQWKKGEDVSTEDLRKALQHYRSFFNRLVV